MKKIWLLCLGLTVMAVRAEHPSEPALEPELGSTPEPVAVSKAESESESQAKSHSPQVTAIPEVEINPALERIGSPEPIVLSIIRKSLARQDYYSAREQIASFLAVEQKDRQSRAEAIFWAAYTELRLKQPAACIVQLNRWLTLFADLPDTPRVHFLLGQAYREMGAYDRAKDSFYKTMSSSVARIANHAEVGLRSTMRLTVAAGWELAETEYQAKNWQRASELFLRFREQNPQFEWLTQTALYREADCAYQQAQGEEALQKYQTALSVGPFHEFAPEGWWRILSLQTLRGGREDQKQALQALIWSVQELCPEQTEYWQQRCAAVILSTMPADGKGRTDVLQQLQPYAGDFGWKNLFQFQERLLYLSQGEAVPKESAEQDHDQWNQWKERYDTTLQELRQRANYVLNPAQEISKP
jgi:tetratricopeptide (TPR) repeat protein